MFMFLTLVFTDYEEQCVYSGVLGAYCGGDERCNEGLLCGSFIRFGCRYAGQILLYHMTLHY